MHVHVKSRQGGEWVYIHGQVAVVNITCGKEGIVVRFYVILGTIQFYGIAEVKSWSMTSC